MFDRIDVPFGRDDAEKAKRFLRIVVKTVLKPTGDMHPHSGLHRGGFAVDFRLAVSIQADHPVRPGMGVDLFDSGVRRKGETAHHIVAPEPAFRSENDPLFRIGDKIGFVVDRQI